MTTIALHHPHRPTKKKPKRRVWQLRWTGDRIDPKTGGFVRHCETIKDSEAMTKADAKAIQRKRQSAMDGGALTPDKPEKVTLAAYVKHHLEMQETDTRFNTVHSHKVACDHAIATLGKDFTLGSLKLPEAARIKRRLTEKGLKRSTSCLYLQKLGAMMKRAIAEGYAKDNPFDGLSNGKRSAKSARNFTPTEMDAMFAVAPSAWWQVFLRVGFSTGLRKGEIYNLLWSDVDLDHEYLHVRPKEAGTFSVAGISYPIFAWAVKNDRERSLPLSPELVELLRGFRLTSGGSRYVFVSLNRLRHIADRIAAGRWFGNNDLLSSYVLPRYKTLQDEARAWLAEKQGVNLDDIDWPVGTIHDMRKTYTNIMKRHVTPDVLAKLLGDNVETVVRYYATPTQDDAAIVRRAIATEFTTIPDAQQTRNALTRSENRTGATAIAV